MNLRRILLRGLRRHGIALKRFKVYQSESHQVIKACERANCTILFDIGANIGQFAQECFESGFMGTIVSVEPLSSAHQILRKRANGVQNWIIAPRCAVGDKAGTTSIYIAKNGVSSSLMEVTERSMSADERTSLVDSEDVEVTTLDALVPSFAHERHPIALKLDTQGYERMVLDGAAKILDAVGLIYVEMSLAPVYVGAPRFDELFCMLTERGFQCIGIFPCFTDPNTYEVLQVNGLFSRRKSDLVTAPALT